MGAAARAIEVGFLDEVLRLWSAAAPASAAERRASERIREGLAALGGVDEEGIGAAARRIHDEGWLLHHCALPHLKRCLK